MFLQTSSKRPSGVFRVCSSAFEGSWVNFLLELRSLFLLFFMVPGLVSNEFRSRPRVDCTKCDFVFYFGSINFY